mgnify:CR=1 FL=1
MSEWWHGLLLIAVCVAVAAYVIAMYWRDRVDLSRGVGWSLTFLRLLAFTGILFFFLDLEKRTEDREIKPSRAVLLVDTSQSMGLRDTPAAGGAATASRLDEVIRELHSGELLEQLRARHDLAVYQFGDQPEPAQVAFFRRTGKQTIDRGTAEELAAARQATHQTARTITLLAAGLLGLAAAALLVYLGLGRRTPLRPAGAFAPPLSVVALAAAGVLLATARLSAPDLSWRAVAGLVEPDFAAEVQAELAELAERKAAQDADRAATDASEPADIPWDTALLPRGTATRLGDALRTIVNAERGGPLAGIIVATDGGNNAGIDGDVAAQIAHGAGIPVFAVGLGSDRQPVNARVVDLEAPKRVYPGDKFTLTGYLQAYGLSARLVSAQLLSAPGDMQLDDGTERSDQVTVEEERSVRLAADGQMVTLKFEVTPSEVGARQFILRVVPPGEDLEPRDNQKTARVRVVERKSRVLLIAGDRGLAGAYNANAVRRATSFVERYQRPARWVTVGRKGTDLIRRWIAAQKDSETAAPFLKQQEIVAEFSHLPADPDVSDVTQIVQVLFDEFLNQGADEVFVAYTNFINTVTQQPRVLPLLPLRPFEASSRAIADLVETPPEVRLRGRDYLYEPDAVTILDEVIPRFTELQILQAIRESLSSEHSARMVAMRNASESAEALRGLLQLDFNKARQLAITGEILDIIGGVEALKQNDD